MKVEQLSKRSQLHLEYFCACMFVHWHAFLCKPFSNIFRSMDDGTEQEAAEKVLV